MSDLSDPRSLWLETAVASPNLPSLEGAVDADVAIIGGGYTGLSAALRAIELGLSPVIVEATDIGWGASGRNGGVVSTKYRVSLSDIAKTRGVSVAQQMHRLGHEAMDCVESYMSSLSISDAGFSKTGNLRCAHNKVALARLVAEATAMQDMFGDTSMRILDKSEIRAETGTGDFVGGVLSLHAGIIHPVNYARGLAKAVLRNGGRIYNRSPMVARKSVGGRICLITANGTVNARKVLIATNGYSDLTPGTAPLDRTVIPFRSAMVATEPLDDQIFQSIMPNNRSYSETRRMMRWYRRVGNRVLFGGRGAFGRSDSDEAFNALESALKRLYPQLENAAVTHRWSGLVAMTMDSMPQVGMLDENCGYSLGYNGTGIAMSSLLGRRAIDMLAGHNPELALMRRRSPPVIPFYFLREPAVRVVAGWYQFLDRIGA